MLRRDLERLEKLNVRINELLLELHRIRKPYVDNKTKCCPGAVSVRYTSDPTGLTGIKAAEYSAEIDKLIDEYYGLRSKACKQIRSLSDEREAVILCQRYIHLKTWGEVQNRLKCGHGTLFRKHNSALEKIK